MKSCASVMSAVLEERSGSPERGASAEAEIVITAGDHGAAEPGVQWVPPGLGCTFLPEVQLFSPAGVTGRHAVEGQDGGFGDDLARRLADLDDDAIDGTTPKRA